MVGLNMEIDEIALQYYTLIDSIPSLEDIDGYDSILRYIPFIALDAAYVAEIVMDSILFSPKSSILRQRHEKGVNYLKDNIELALLSSDSFIRELAKQIYNNKDNLKQTN